MAEPVTGGQLRTSLSDMQVGDYIACYTEFNEGLNPVFYSSRTSVGEIPYTGLAGTNGNSYTFYFIKVDKGLLIADRVTQTSIKWDKLNAENKIQGDTRILFDKTGIIRSLGGGNSYADANGNSSTADARLGAWPVDNEWDEYITRKDYGTGAGRDDVWHFGGVWSWAQDTPLIGKAPASERVVRGSNLAKNFNDTLSNNGAANMGFRPVFQYEEVTP